MLSSRLLCEALQLRPTTPAAAPPEQAGLVDGRECSGRVGCEGEFIRTGQTHGAGSDRQQVVELAAIHSQRPEVRRASFSDFEISD